MPKIIGAQQKAYSRERNIGSILLNLMNMEDHVNKKKLESLILLVDFKKGQIVLIWKTDLSPSAWLPGRKHLT